MTLCHPRVNTIWAPGRYPRYYVVLHYRLPRLDTLPSDQQPLDSPQMTMKDVAH